LKLEKIIRDDQQIQIISELDESIFEQFKQKAARKISQSAKIPGFRPGKAPYNVILRMYGEEAIEEQAKELLVDDTYPKVIEQGEIKPSGPGTLEKIISVHPPKFSFIIPLEPEVKLGDYLSIRQPYNLPDVSEKDMDAYIHRLQTSYATAEPAERPAQKGDLIYLKLSGKITNPTENEDPDFLKETTSQVLIGDEAFEENNFPFTGFADEMIGLSANAEKEIKYTYPKKYESEKLQDKAVVFKVTVQSIKSMKLPELNDDFAKMVGNFENFDKFRSTIHTQLEFSAKQEYEKVYFNEIFEKIHNQATIKYPPQMLEHEAEHALESVEKDLAAQKLDLETYLKANKKDKDSFIKDEVTPIAKKRLEQSLVFEELAHLEKIQLEKVELSQAFNQTVQELQLTSDFQKLQKKMAPKQLTNAIALEAANRLMNDHVLSRLKDIATGKAAEEKKSSETGEKQAESKPASKKKPAISEKQIAEGKTQKPKTATKKVVKKDDKE
jgi:trigger factor